MSDSVYRKSSTEELRESPTISTIAIDDTDHDVEGGTEDYQLNIRHARDWKPYSGERYGFMANVTYRHHPFASTANGEFYPGEDQDTYNKAVENGKELAKRRQAELDTEMANAKARERVTDAIEQHFPNESDFTISLMRRTTAACDVNANESMSDIDLEDLLNQVYEAVIFTTGDYPEGCGFGSSDFNIVKERVQRNVDAWHKWKAEQAEV